VTEKSATAVPLAPTRRRRTMKYICLGYIEPGKFEGMTEDERHATFDECFEYNDHQTIFGSFCIAAARSSGTFSKPKGSEALIRLCL